jgi:putative ABC transport system permease protein
MNLFAQTGAITAVSLRSLPQRPGNSLVIVVGIAAVSAAIISMLAMSAGFGRTIQGGARADRVLFLTANADDESSSVLSRDKVAILEAAPGIARDASGKALLSAEIVLVAPVARKNNGADAYITLRGVGTQANRVRPEVKIVSGRMFETGLHELVVGQAAAKQFANVDVGSRVQLHDGGWTVVGVFAGGDNVRDSEAIADAQTLLSSYKLDAFNSATALLADATSLRTLRKALESQPGLDVKALTEPEYLSVVSAPTHRLLRAVALTIGTLMAIGALFGALNTMYSAVAARSREIATLRALGFASGAIVTAILFEALLLSLFGAALGIGAAYAAFDGQAISTLGGSRWDSQLVYSLTITRALALEAATLAGAIGLIGGLIPALRAMRVPVAHSLRAG